MASMREANRCTTLRNGGKHGLLAAAGLLAMAGACGCSVGPTVPAAVPGALFQGRITGGQQPVVGVTVALYAAGTSGYGSAYSYPVGKSLLGNNVVRTDTQGRFSITGDYSCPTVPAPDSLVYLVGTGGQPVPGKTNPNLGMMVALGPCRSLTSATFVQVNELTTIASVWALSPFMTGISNIGTTPGNVLGLTNAFAAVNKVVNTANGTLPGPNLPPGASLPVAEINTLADILESCINSVGGTAGDGTACGTLFANAIGAVTPTDTITAAMNIAQHPAANVTVLSNLVLPAASFQPTLQSAPPAAWTIAINYTGGGLNSPQSLAPDAVGNIWVANAGGNSVTKLDINGAALSGTTGFTVGALNTPSAIAIDQTGNAWVTNRGNSTLTEIISTGASGTAFTGGGLNSPQAVAIDAAGKVWVANHGDSTVRGFTAAGVPLAGPFSAGGVNQPVAIAINPH